MKRSAMTDAQLLAQIELLESQCGNTTNSEVAKEQATAMDYYMSRPFGTEEEGRSQVISSDVWDVVEGLTPLVLKPFVSSDDIVRFNPEGEEDEEAAEQESDYINFVVTQKNDVFDTLISWVKTGLLQKNGIVKYWWEDTKRTSIERYDGLEDDVYTMLLDDERIAVVSHTEKPGAPEIDPQTGQQVQGAPTHDVVFRVTEPHGEPRYCVIPPEEFRISRDATSSNPKNASFVQHITRKTISALREMGYEVDDDINDSVTDDPQHSEQYRARRSEDQSQFNSETNDPSMREVIYRETIMRVDFDGDGMAELRKVCIVGDTILHNEETEEINYCGWTPYPQPFKFDGRCPADETVEIQLIKSSVLRQTMDNIYTVNNNTRYVSDKVNLDDLLDNQIAGIVRVQGDVVGNHVMPAPITPIGNVTMPMIEYFDSAKENRTGFTRYNQGTDSNSLNKTATGIRIIAEAGNERVALVSRCFAEQGLKPLMLGIHGLCRRHSTKAETMRLRGKWVTVDPRDWKTRYDMSVSVGLGSSDKQIQMQGAQLLLQTQANLMQVPGLVSPKNFYEAGSLLAKSLGEKNPDKYFTTPPEQPQPEPDPTEDPEFKLKAADVSLKAHQVDVTAAQRDKELALQERELALKEQQAKHNALMGEAEFKRAGEMQEPVVAPEEDKESEELAVIAQNQAAIYDALNQLMQQFADSQAAIASVMASQQAKKPMKVRMKKDADGSYVGERIEEPEEQPQG